MALPFFVSLYVMNKATLILGILYILVFWSIPSISAQESWSLEKCIKYAHENNLQIKQQQLIVEQSQNNIQQSKLDFLPSVNASISHNMNWGKSVNINDLQINNTVSQSTSSSIGASMPILQGLAKVNTLKSNKIQLQISQQDIEKLKNDITISITQAFLQILLSNEIYKSAQESYNSVAGQVEQCKKLVDAGSQAYSALLDIQAQLANEHMQLISAKNEVRSNYLALAQLLDLPQNIQFNIEAPSVENLLDEFQIMEVEQIYNSAQSLPQIRSAELSLEKSKYDYKIQKGNLYPSLSFSAGYGTYFSDNQQQAFFTQFNENRNPSVGFTLSIPIFNGWRTRNAVRNAKLNITRGELELKKSHQQLYKDIQQAYNNAQNAYEKHLAAKQNVDAAQESFNYVKQKFDIGMLNGTDYIVAKTNLFKSKSEYSQTKFQYIFQLKILDFYKGNPIKL